TGGRREGGRLVQRGTRRGCVGGRHGGRRRHRRLGPCGRGGIGGGQRRGVRGLGQVQVEVQRRDGGHERRRRRLGRRIGQHGGRGCCRCGAPGGQRDGLLGIGHRGGAALVERVARVQLAAHVHHAAPVGAAA